MQKDELHNLRHTLAHLLAAAVLDLYPGTMLTIGPSIDTGFYYDFEFKEPISETVLPKIEKKMKRILTTWNESSHREVTADEAKEIYKNNPYKQELVDEIESKGEKITLYKFGEFEDLCRGGHLENPQKEINDKAFKLLSVAGAYWRGDENNTMLTRIYAAAFKTEKELGEYLEMLEEAKKRDHRKLGKELDLFFVDEMVGKGLVMWLPKGNIIKDQIERLAVEMEERDGYVRVTTPHIAKEELFLTSGHLPYYKDGMYPAMKMDDGTYYLRAMNCPHHHRIFSHKPKSYRDLPLRVAEYGTVYRNELSGTLAGLLRVRGLAMNDAHIYCTKDQIKEEFKAVMNLTIEYFKIFGLKDYWFRLSKWDPTKTEKYINQPENWEHAQATIKEVLDEMKVDYTEEDDEAAFYGPKVDVQFKSVTGREETMSTIQLDFVAKERFGLSYIDKDGKENNEVFVIHRAPLSTHERFTAFLIEHYAGVFPLWLSPEQIRIIPLAENHNKFAWQTCNKLKKEGFRVEVDDSNENLGKKIRNAKVSKVPYYMVIGDNEVDSDVLKIENRSGEAEELELDKLIKKLQKEVGLKS